MAKQQCLSTCCCNQARRPVATLCRWEPTAFDARALGRDPRIHRGATWATFTENRVKSLHIVSYQFMKSHPFVFLRPLVIRTVLHLQDRHIRDRRKFAEEMLARLALGPGRRIARKISTSRRLDLDVTFFSDEKIFRVDAAAPGRSSHTFYQGKVERRNNATPVPFSGYTMRKGEVALLRRTFFEPLFTTHPSLVGSTSPWTLRDVAYRALSPDLSPHDYFLWVLRAIPGASAWSSCPLSARSNRCVTAFHV